MQRDVLILSGGGTKCVSFLGVLAKLNKNAFTKYFGVSGGSVLCSLLSVGYSPQTLFDELMGGEEIAVEINPFNILCNNQPMADLSWLREAIETMFVRKGFARAVTFRELYTVTKKTLNIGVFHSGENHLMNHLCTPHAIVSNAVLISCGVPLLFTRDSVMDGCIGDYMTPIVAATSSEETKLIVKMFAPIPSWREESGFLSYMYKMFKAATTTSLRTIAKSNDKH